MSGGLTWKSFAAESSVDRQVVQRFCAGDRREPEKFSAWLIGISRRVGLEWQRTRDYKLHHLAQLDGGQWYARKRTLKT
jgi:hypothetical protein